MTLTNECPNCGYLKCVCHDEDVQGSPLASDETAEDVTCCAKWFTAGGRDERECLEPADEICKRCGLGVCREHVDHLAIDEDGICEMCNESW